LLFPEIYFKNYIGRVARGLMVSALVSGSSSLGSSPGQGHCVVFLGKTGVEIGAGEFKAGGNPVMD